MEQQPRMVGISKNFSKFLIFRFLYLFFIFFILKFGNLKISIYFCGIIN